MALDTLVVFGASYDTEDEAVADYEAVRTDTFKAVSSTPMTRQ